MLTVNNIDEFSEDEIQRAYLVTAVFCHKMSNNKFRAYISTVNWE